MSPKIQFPSRQVTLLPGSVWTQLDLKTDSIGNFIEIEF